MKKIISLIVISLFFISISKVYAQTVSMRVQQVDYNSADPDGGGPATASVTVEFQLMASVAGIMADGMGLSFVYQSSMLLATPTNTTVPVGPLAVAGINWVQGVDNRVGNPVNVSYGGQSFDKRMIVNTYQNSGIPNVEVPTVWTGFIRITYWTLGSANPQGGYVTSRAGQYCCTKRTFFRWWAFYLSIPLPNTQQPCCIRIRRGAGTNFKLPG